MHTETPPTIGFFSPSSPLHYRNFVNLTLCRVASTLGVQMLSVAIGWHVYELTKDPFAIGLIGLFQFLPSAFLVLFAGHIADQFDRRKILTITYGAAAVGGLILMLATFNDVMTPHIIYLVAVLLGVVRIFGAPAQQALLPNVVPPEVFSKAIATNSGLFQIATIVGPALAGVTFFLGTGAVYLFSMMILLAAMAASIFITVRSGGVKRAVNLENLMAGIKFIFARPPLLGAISLDLFAVLFGGVVALLPVYAADILHIGPQGLGLLRSAPAVGAALMSIALVRYSLKRNVGFWLFASVVVFGLSTIIFGISTSPILSMAMLFILGAADMVSVFVRTHLMQANTPDDMRGRVASVNMFFVTTSNELGDFQSGTLAGWFGAMPAVVFGGVMSIMVAGLIAWKVPSLRNLKTLEEVK